MTVATSLSSSHKCRRRIRLVDHDLDDVTSRSSLLIDGYRLECSRLHGHQMREYRAVDVANGEGGSVVRIHRLLDAGHCRRRLLWLAHRNVLRYLDAFVHDADVHLVSEAKIVDVLGYVEDGEIPVGWRRERLVRKWTGEVLEAMAYGRSLGLHHNDLRWREVHLDARLEASLANFARLTFDDEAPCPVRSCSAAADEAASVGRAVFELLFDDDIAVASARLRSLTDDEDADESSEVSSQAKDFLKRLLMDDESHRLDIEDALRHPWMQPSVENFFASPVVALEDDDDGPREEESDERSRDVAAGWSVSALLLEARDLPVAVTVASLVSLLVVGFFYYRRTDAVDPTLLDNIVRYSKYLLRTVFLL